MKRMTALNDHERRITALEGRSQEVENTYGETLYKVHRRLAKLELRWAMLFQRYKIRDVSDEEVDEVLDAE